MCILNNVGLCLPLPLFYCLSFKHCGLCVLLTMWGCVSFKNCEAVCPLNTVGLCVLLLLWGCVSFKDSGTVCPFNRVGLCVLLTIWGCVSIKHCRAVCPFNTVGLCVLLTLRGCVPFWHCGAVCLPAVIHYVCRLTRFNLNFLAFSNPQLSTSTIGKNVLEEMKPVELSLTLWTYLTTWKTTHPATRNFQSIGPLGRCFL